MSDLRRRIEEYVTLRLTKESPDPMDDDYVQTIEDQEARLNSALDELVNAINSTVSEEEAKKAQ